MKPVFFIILLLTIAYVAADQIVQGALAKIFPYAAAAKVKTLTTQLNKQTTAATAKTVLNTWATANWKAATAKLVATDPLSKLVYAKNKASTFIDMRYSLKKYISYLSNQAIKSKYLTQAEATQMKKLFWAADIETLNNYTATCQVVAVKGSAAIKKTPPITQKITELTTAFAKANPKDYNNLHWSL